MKVIDKKWLTVSDFIILLTIVTSAFTIIPIVLLPFLILVLISIYYVANRSENFINLNHYNKNYKDFRFWLIFFTLYSLIFAFILGVNIFDWQLYRFQFRFVFPFIFLLLASLLRYSINVVLYIKYILFGIGIFQLIFFLFSIFYFMHNNEHQFFGNTYIWQFNGSYFSYIGPFLSAVSAGAFFAVISVYYLTFLLISNNNVKEKIILYILLISSMVELSLSYARGAILSLFVILFFLIIIQIKNHKFTKTMLISILTLLLIVITLNHNKIIKTVKPAVVTVKPAVINLYRKTIFYKILPKSINRLFYHHHNIIVRFIRYGLYINYFIKSPLFGIGPSTSTSAHIQTLLVPFKLPIKQDLLFYSPLKYLKINHFIYFNQWKDTVFIDDEANNVYLGILGEGGIILFSAFILMYYLIFKNLYRLFKNTKNIYIKELSAGTLYSLIVLAIFSLTGNYLLAVEPLVMVFAISSYLLSFEK